jgi:hypothetical protein
VFHPTFYDVRPSSPYEVQTIPIKPEDASNITVPSSLLVRADEVIEWKPSTHPGPAMTLGNMRELGVQRLVAYCLNPSCRHEGLIDVWKYRAVSKCRGSP